MSRPTEDGVDDSSSTTDTLPTYRSEDQLRQLVEIVEVAPGEYLVSGQVHVDDLEERTGLVYERYGFDTLGGLIMARLGRIPVSQEVLEVEGARLTVQKMEGRRILQVLVQRQDR